MMSQMFVFPRKHRHSEVQIRSEGSNPSLSASSPSPRNSPITMASSPDESLDHLTAKLAQLFESSSVVKREFVIIKSQ